MQNTSESQKIFLLCGRFDLKIIIKSAMGSTLVCFMLVKGLQRYKPNSSLENRIGFISSFFVFDN
jgi:hypothetical protein